MSLLSSYVKEKKSKLFPLTLSDLCSSSPSSSTCSVITDADELTQLTQNILSGHISSTTLTMHFITSVLANGLQLLVMPLT